MSSEQLSTTEVVTTSGFQTSDSPYIVDGLGDAFLLLAATVDESLYTTLQASPGSNGPLSQCSITPPYDAPQARFNPQRQLVWYSVYDIQVKEIPLAQQLADGLVAENGGSTVFSSAVQQLAFINALNSVARWQELLALNTQLKAAAVPWPELSAHFVQPTSRLPLDLSGVTELQSSTLIVSFTGSMGEVSLSLTNTSEAELTTSAGNTTTHVTNGVFTFSAEVNFEIGAVELPAFGTDDSVTAGTGSILEVDVAITTASSSESTVTIVLSDPDQGDEFSVAILRDPRYNTPVYQTLSGRSRCDAEAGTVSREVVSMSLSQASFTQVPQGSVVSTVLTINNLSPFQETFDYLLNVDIGLNPGGIEVEANGNQLTSNAVQLTLPYGATEVLLTFEQSPGSNANEFALTMVLSSADCGEGSFLNFQWDDALYDTALIEISFIPQCAQVAWAGDLVYSSAFTVNAASDGLYAFSISNPNAFSQGGSWEALNASGVLQSIVLQYEPADGNAAEWLPVPVADGGAQQPISDDYYSSDYYSFVADLSSLSGSYNFRIVAQCAQPVDADDPSAYQTVSGLVTGVVDLVGPSVLQYEPRLQPGDSVPTFYTGDSISVALSEPVSCSGAHSLLSASAWYNRQPNKLRYGPGQQGNKALPPLSSLCQDNTIQLGLSQPPPWKELVGSYVAVQVGGFTDLAGNPLAGTLGVSFLTWAFLVAPFNYSSAAVTISYLGLQPSTSALSAQLTSQQQPTGQGRRLLQAEGPEASDADELLQLQSGEAQLLLAASTADLFNGTEAGAALHFRLQLQAAVQAEAVQLLDDWRLQHELTASQWRPEQLELTALTAGRVTFSLVLRPSHEQAAISPAEAGYALVQALLDSGAADGRKLNASRFPVLSQHAVRPHSPHSAARSIALSIAGPSRAQAAQQAAQQPVTPAVPPSTPASLPLSPGGLVGVLLLGCALLLLLAAGCIYSRCRSSGAAGKWSAATVGGLRWLPVSEVELSRSSGCLMDEQAAEAAAALH